MIQSTLYFSPNLALWKESLKSRLSHYGKKVEWKVLELIDQIPAECCIFISEAELNSLNWPVLASRNIIVILEEWNIEASVAWIEKGAANCFSIEDEDYVTSWLVSELTKTIPAYSDEIESNFLQIIIDAIPVPIFYKDHFNRSFRL